MGRKDNIRCKAQSESILDPFEWRILGVAGPHVLSSLVLFIGCFYVGIFILKRRNWWRYSMMLAFLICFAFMLHELFFNPIVDLWNVFTNPSVILWGYTHDVYPYILGLMGLFVIGVWYYFFQGEFHLKQGLQWWVLWGWWCCAWWMIGFHTSLPFWFQSSTGWPWLHDPVAHMSEFIYTLTFMLAFIHCWKEDFSISVRGILPRALR